MKKELALIASLAAGCGGHQAVSPVAASTIAKARLSLRSETVAMLSTKGGYDRGPVFDKSWCRTDCPCDPPPVPPTAGCAL